MNKNSVSLIGAISTAFTLAFSKGVNYGSGVIASIGADGKTDFTAVRTLGATAEILAGYSAGDEVMVEGKLRSEKWVDDAGVKQSDVRVYAIRVLPSVEQGTKISKSGTYVALKGKNEVVIEGNLTRNAVMRYTNTSNIPVTNISIAVNERYNDKAGNPVEQTQWIDITIWGELAEQTAHLTTGQFVTIKGKVGSEVNRVTNKKRLKVIASSVDAGPARTKSIPLEAEVATSTPAAKVKKARAKQTRKPPMSQRASSQASA